MNKALRDALGVVDVTSQNLAPERRVLPDGSDVTAALQLLIHDQVAKVRLLAIENGSTRSVGGTCLYFPPGTYQLSRGVQVPGNVNIAFLGAGSTRTVLNLTGTAYQEGTPIWPIGPSFDDPVTFPIPPPYPLLRASDIDKTAAEWTVAGMAFNQLWRDYFLWVERRYLFHYPGASERGDNLVNNSAYDDAAMNTKGWTTPWIERRLLLGSDGQTPWSFEGLTLRGGGILVAGVTGSATGALGSTAGFGQRQGSVRDVRFERCAAWAIATDGERVVNVDVTDCDFVDCNAGIGLRYAQTDLWTIRDCVFDGTLTIDVQIATATVTVEGCAFRNKPVGSRAFPFVHLKHGPDYLDPEAGGFDGSDPDVTNPSWARSELPGAVYLVPGTKAKTVDPEPAGWPRAMQITRGVHLVDCSFGISDTGWTRDAVVIGRWAEGAVPYPPERVPERPIPGSAGLTITSWEPDTPVARAITIEGCIFGPASAPETAKPRCAVRLTIPVAGLHIIRCSVGRMDFVIYEECSTRLWFDALFVATLLGHEPPETIPNIGLISLQTAILSPELLKWHSNISVLSQLNIGNLVEVTSRLDGAVVPGPTELFSLGGFGFEVTTEFCRNVAREGAVVGSGNLLQASSMVMGPTGMVEGSLGELTVQPTGAPSNDNPRINWLAGQWVGIGALLAVPLALSYEVTSRTAGANTAAFVALGNFVIAGSRFMEAPIVERVPTLMSIVARTTPTRWDLSTRAPAALALHFPTSLLSPSIWEQVRVTARQRRLSQFFTDQHPGLNSVRGYRSRLGAVIYFPSGMQANVRIRELTLSVASCPSAPRPIGLGTVAAPPSDVRLSMLEEETVSTGQEPSPESGGADVVLNSDPKPGQPSMWLGHMPAGEVEEVQ